ncbi:MAG: hypothetical protein HYZ89_05470 [Candidatus Omnitrophica bacterium]|nr:hypothetical protein [Candidatus Omnitrophota bacterium]
MNQPEEARAARIEGLEEIGSQIPEKLKAAEVLEKMRQDGTAITARKQVPLLCAYRVMTSGAA